MKTINQIQSEIDRIKEEYSDSRFHKDFELKRAGKRIVLLQKYVYYLQAGAKEVNLKKDLGVLNKRLQIIENGYDDWLRYNPEMEQLKSPFNKYNSEMDKRKVKRQIEALEYLLDDESNRK